MIFRGFVLSVIVGLFYYVIGVLIGYELSWSFWERFVALFGTGFIVASFSFVYHLYSVEKRRRRSVQYPNDNAFS